MPALAPVLSPSEPDGAGEGAEELVAAAAGTEVVGVDMEEVEEESSDDVEDEDEEVELDNVEVDDEDAGDTLFESITNPRL